MGARCLLLLLELLMCSMPAWEASSIARARAVPSKLPPSYRPHFIVGSSPCLTGKGFNTAPTGLSMAGIPIKITGRPSSPDFLGPKAEDGVDGGMDDDEHKPGENIPYENKGCLETHLGNCQPSTEPLAATTSLSSENNMDRSHRFDSQAERHNKQYRPHFIVGSSPCLTGKGVNTAPTGGDHDQNDIILTKNQHLYTGSCMTNEHASDRPLASWDTQHDSRFYSSSMSSETVGRHSTNATTPRYCLHAHVSACMHACTHRSSEFD